METPNARYDRETDILYVRFGADDIEESEEVRPGLVLDFNADGQIVAMELLDASTRVAVTRNSGQTKYPEGAN